jgi:hypothetical protein
MVSHTMLLIIPARILDDCEINLATLRISRIFDDRLLTAQDYYITEMFEDFLRSS